MDHVNNNVSLTTSVLRAFKDYDNGVYRLVKLTVSLWMMRGFYTSLSITNVISNAPTSPWIALSKIIYVISKTLFSSYILIMFSMLVETDLKFDASIENYLD